MSFELYSKWFAGTRKTLDKLAVTDANLVHKTKALKDRTLAGQLVGGLYAKYAMIVQNMGIILDQLGQPQKRISARKLMNAAAVRLHELNEELRKIDISEYHYIDGALVELKLVPYDVEIIDPDIFYYLRDYTVEDLWTKIKNGERIYTPPPVPTEDELAAESIVIEPNPQEEEPPKGKKAKKQPKKYVPEVKILTAEEEEALQQKERVKHLVTLIQKQERARQARWYFFEMSASHRQRKAVLQGIKLQPPPSMQQQEEATLQMERYWRGHIDRQMLKRKEKERRFLIGMIEPSWRSKAEFDKLEQNRQIRRTLRDQRIKEYIETNLSERERIFRVVGPGLMEDIGDEIREWFHQWHVRAKNFDVIPDEEKGGTVLVVRAETMTPEEWIADQEKKKREKGKNKANKEKAKQEKLKQKQKEAEKKKKEKEKLKKEKERKKRMRRKGDFELEFEPSGAANLLTDGITEYKELWNERKDEDNPLEMTYDDLITEEKCYEMQLELRKQVDELMRIELDLLNDALDRDRAKGKKVKKKRKKKKKKKKKKKRQKKDPTGNRSLEDLFQELVDNGIIHTYGRAKLADYKGDFSYNNWEMRNLDFDPPATLGDVRQAIKINCIAPLSVEIIKKPRSVLIVGPRQSGKHLLADAVFTESHCVLFDLSAEILVGKYPGKKGMKMLLHLINKMSRLLQPSIIYLEGAERAFYKKVPKLEKDLDPKRIGKKLVKGIVKTIKPEDRVLVLGITGKPWLAGNKLKKAFERIILLPRPDYGSVFLYWKELLMSYHSLDRNFNVSALAKVTTYYPLSVLKETAEAVLNPRRIIQLNKKPLNSAELYEPLLTQEPITDKEYNKFLKWYKKTPLGKERIIFNKLAERKREQEAKALEKQNQKKAKK